MNLLINETAFHKLKLWAIEPSNPSKVKVFGPGIENGVKTNQATHFTVDCQGAGNGKLN